MSDGQISFERNNLSNLNELLFVKSAAATLRYAFLFELKKSIKNSSSLGGGFEVDDLNHELVGLGDCNAVETELVAMDGDAA